MPTTKALIRKNKVNKKGECVVFIRYYHNDSTTDITTGITVRPSDWIAGKQRINSQKSISNSKSNFDLLKELEKKDRVNNTKIRTERARIETLVTECILKGVDPSPAYVKEKYLNLSNKSDDLINNNIESLFEDFISATQVSNNTKKSYKTTLGHLRLYQKKVKKTLKVADINLKLYEDYLNFLLNEIENSHGGKGLATNSVGASIKNFKVFLRYLVNHGHNLKVQISDFKVLEEPPKIFFLTEIEIEQLYALDLSKNLRLERVRDLFVFNCFTGLRYSDLSRLERHHIIDGAIDMRAFKNLRDIYIPITKVPKEILTKYDYELPRISEQKFNNYIKEVCEKAGIKCKVERVTIKSGNKIYDYPEKWSVITSHVAVKTFITLCGSKSIQPKTVSEITGKSVNIIMKHYYGTNKRTIKDEMERAFG